MIFPHTKDGDFYHRYRPRTWEEVMGQSGIISSIRKIVSDDNSTKSLLFFGDSGCGKTTTARLFAMAVNCTNRSGDNPCCSCPSCKEIMQNKHMDVIEINAADTRGIDSVRDIKDNMSLRSMFGGKKVYILDECQSLTKDAQQSLLKILEEAPKDVYVILCSTEPAKLLPTVRNRCQKFEFKPVNSSILIDLMEQVCTFEGLSFNKNVLRKIADNSSGSPRNCLVYLQQVAQAGSLNSDSDDINDIISVVSDDSKEAIELSIALIKRQKWSVITEMLANIKVPPEVTRLTVLGFFRSRLLKATDYTQASSYAKIMETLINPFHTIRPENNLVLCIYKVWEILKKV